MELLANGETRKIQEIEAFCQSFGGDFSQWTVEAYCQRVSSAVAKTEDQIKRDPLFSIAMPPHLVKDYLKRMWNFDSTVTQLPPGIDNGRDGLVGMIVPKGTKSVTPSGAVKLNTGYNGLVHYMYRHGWRYYSWGMSAFTSLKAAQQGGASDLTKDWKVGWFIEVQRPD